MKDIRKIRVILKSIVYAFIIIFCAIAIIIPAGTYSEQSNVENNAINEYFALWVPAIHS